MQSLAFLAMGDRRKDGPDVYPAARRRDAQAFAYGSIGCVHPLTKAAQANSLDIGIIRRVEVCLFLPGLH